MVFTLGKLKKFYLNLFFEPCFPDYRQLIIYCIESNLSDEDYSQKVDYVSQSSSDKANEIDYDMWYHYCNQDKLLLTCEHFSEMDDMYEETVNRGIPAGFICNKDNNIILLSVGPSKGKVFDELINNLNKRKN